MSIGLGDASERVAAPPDVAAGRSGKAIGPGRRYEPALDGIRGLAVAAVLLFHAGHLAGGYLGVDAFFVLSGFLITSLLLAEAATSARISLRSFWSRRARRLLPALACVLGAVAIYAAVVAAPSSLSDIRHDFVATMLYAANWRSIYGHQNYFALFQSPSPLQHMWSLAIEEQFYLGWPLVVFVCVRSASARTAARRVLVASAVLATASFVWAQVLYDPANPSRVYYGTDTRIFQILIGASLAAAVARFGTVQKRIARTAVEGSALVAIAALAVMFARLHGSSRSLYRGGELLCAIAVAAVIAAATHPQRGAVARALSWRPLRALGLISYAVYLWHWPVDVYLDAHRAHLTGWPLVGLQAAVTVVLATISFYAVERPVRRGAVSTRWMFALVPATAAVLVVGMIAATTEPAGYSLQPADYSDVPTRNSASWNQLLLYYSHEALTTPGVHVAVVGDSVALTMRNASASGFFRGHGIDGASFGAIGCSLTTGGTLSGGVAYKANPHCDAWLGLYSDVVRAFSPKVVVLMVGPWEMFDRVVGGHRVDAGSPTSTARLLASLEMLRTMVASRGARLVVLDTPCFPSDVANAYGAAPIWRDPHRLAWLNGVWHEFAARHPGTVSLGDLDGLICRNGHPRNLAAGAVVRPDGIHYTATGARIVWRWIASLPDVRAAIHAAAGGAQTAGRLRP